MSQSTSTSQAFAHAINVARNGLVSPLSALETVTREMWRRHASSSCVIPVDSRALRRRSVVVQFGVIILLV